MIVLHPLLLGNQRILQHADSGILNVEHVQIRFFCAALQYNVIFVINRGCSHIHLIIEKLIHRKALLHQLDILFRIKSVLLHKSKHLKLLTTKPGTDLLALHLCRVGNACGLLSN
ncbi:hypothetical protein D3C74_423010 [compost metagenome]